MVATTEKPVERPSLQALLLRDSVNATPWGSSGLSDGEFAQALLLIVTSQESDRPCRGCIIDRIEPDGTVRLAVEDTQLCAPHAARYLRQEDPSTKNPFATAYKG